MTIQEAIERIKYRIYTATQIVGKGEDGKAFEDFEMAIEALERQIPKKPNIEGDGYDPEGNFVYDTWICPNCEIKYELECQEYDHCPNCGQAIDWSEDNEPS